MLQKKAKPPVKIRFSTSESTYEPPHPPTSLEERVEEVWLILVLLSFCMRRETKVRPPILKEQNDRGTGRLWGYNKALFPL